MVSYLVNVHLAQTKIFKSYICDFSIELYFLLLCINSPYMNFPLAHLQ